MPRMLLDTADRIPTGAIVELAGRCAVLARTVPDPCPNRPSRLRFDLLDVDSHLWEPPEWADPGEIVHYTHPTT